MLKKVVLGAVSLLLASGPATSAKMTETFIGCFRVEHLTDLVKFRDSEELTMVYMAAAVVDGKCLVLEKNQEVNVVGDMDPLPITIIEKGGEKLYTASTAIEKGHGDKGTG